MVSRKSYVSKFRNYKNNVQMVRSEDEVELAKKIEPNSKSAFKEIGRKKHGYCAEDGVFNTQIMENLSAGQILNECFALFFDKDNNMLIRARYLMRKRTYVVRKQPHTPVICLSVYPLKSLYQLFSPISKSMFIFNRLSIMIQDRSKIIYHDDTGYHG